MRARTVAGATLLAALAFPASLPAQEAVAQSAIRLGHLRPSVPDNSSLSGECRPGASGELVCDFVWTWLEYRVDPGDLEAQTARQIARVRQEIVSQGLTRYLEQLCYPAEEIDEVKLAIDRHRRAGARRTARNLEALLNACAEATQAAVEAFWRNDLLEGSRTCVLSYWRLGPITFRSAGPEKWTAEDIPEGSCGERYSYTLESPQAWPRIVTRTLTRVDDSSEACKRRKPGETWRYAVPGYEAELSCERIDFGW